jgi:ectoine hydroxylase-related dioxygenase (phytanoyl-CoA dioxygenase family)
MSAVKSSDGVRAITEEEIAAFHANGWVRLDGLLSRELTDELLMQAKIVMSTPDDGAAAARTADGQARRVAGVKQVVDVGAWHDRRRLAVEGKEPFASVAFSPQLGADVQKLMRREVGIRYRTDYLACKMPAGQPGSARTHWHQDIRFMPHDRAGTVNVWIALQEVTPAQGSLRFLTRSHIEGLAGWADDLSTERQDIFDRYEISPPLHLRPGDATIHHSYTIHGAPENATTKPRWTYVVSYFPTDVRYTGMPSPEHDELGLAVGEPIEHDRFPLVTTNAQQRCEQ